MRSGYGDGMQAMIWIGAALTAAGLAGLFWCIRKAMWLKGVQGKPDAPDDQQIQAEINRLIFGHMAAIGAAFLGMGVLVAGLLLV
ncbi:MAG: hypothetical protein AAGJ28_15285 [Pseudomonadota bacterium]